MGYRTPLRDCGLAIVDFETGGLDPAIYSPIEIGIVVTDPTGQKILHQYETKILPREGTIVTVEAAKVNGYTEKKWAEAGAITAAQAWKAIRPLVLDCIFVAHNVAFDWGFMLTMCGGYNGWPGPYHRVDTAALAWPLLRKGKIADVKLDTVARWAGHENSAAHTALADAHACRAAYLALMEALTGEMAP